MLFGISSTHFHSKLEIDIFRFNNITLKKRFSDFVYDFSDRITYYDKINSHLLCEEF